MCWHLVPWNSSLVKCKNPKLILDHFAFPRVFLLIRERSYHRAFSLDGFDVHVVLHASGGAAVWYLVLPSLSDPRLVLAVLPGRRRPRRQVAALFLGDVGLRAVDRLHVLPERAGICVALGTTRDLTDVGFLHIQRKTQMVIKVVPTTWYFLNSKQRILVVVSWAVRPLSYTLLTL